MKMMMMASTLSGVMFTQMNHPLAMGMMLLMQTMIMCLISGIMHQSFWFQYILFMVFIGGMLVLFIYVASLASNEMFSMSAKMVLMAVWMMTMSTMINTQVNHDSSDSTTYNTTSNETILMTSKLYNQPSGVLTILAALYLLMTLIVVVKITNVSKGPLRQSM
uniref:NADH-ubiquinone oxidoreductase chain 6 n=1 Tax=Cryptotermes sp. 5 AB-2022a TaxID=2942708 RepID=A0A8X8RH43_9NEOP|nr:NADH dehydrogenase subunit 6 [Cryptotermes sp. 5 AB-2022a]